MANRKKKMDKLVVIDLEATCYEEGFPRGEQQEIIEIGVCLLDLKTLKVENPQGLIVRPTMSRVSPFCTQLTTLTQEFVDKGMTLPEAMAILEKDYEIDKRTWGSWGDFDRKLMLKDCAAKGIQFPGETRTHINIKNIVSVELGLDKELGMDAGCELYGLKLEGTHHRGIDDAKNIAKIYRTHMAKARGWIPSLAKMTWDEHH